MNAWQFAKMQHAADLHGWTRFVAMQDQYNLIKREEEREMLPMCADMGVGCVPYSPQGKGRLTRPWGAQTDRSAVDVVAKSFDLDVDRPVVDAVERVAESLGIPMSQVALAWLLTKPVVSAPIVGATKPHHLADAAAAVEVTLTEDEIRQLQELYTPQAPYWW
jgi:aryl-alcohol dehydrogenase-like predicted oxidoreductase